jgi:hypothetical protein
MSASGRRVVGITLGLLFAGAAVVGLAVGPRVGARFADNRRCCQLSAPRAALLAVLETLRIARFHAEVGQDKWVSARVFPGVADGYFVDVGSGHGWIGSNTAALERLGWRGVCIDPFPVHMDGRTCTVREAVVFSSAGLAMPFHVAGGLGGLAETLGAWNTRGASAAVVYRPTVTLAGLLDEVTAPPFIHFVSLDIEGAEYEALRGFPFDRHRVGAWAIEHNREEPKRTRIRTLLESRGYRRVHTWRQDDYYVAASLGY